MAQISSGVNACCYQLCSLWCHEQTLFSVIRPLAGENAIRFAESLNDHIIFINISAFTVCFAFGFFSAPEPKAQVHYCDHALSVVRPSLTFHIFDFSSETTERNSRKLDRKPDLKVKQVLDFLYQFCVFWVDRTNKMAALASDWLRHFGLLLWNRCTEFNKTWQEARSQPPLPSSCFSCRLEKQDARPGLWLAETFSTSSRNSTKLERKQDLNVLYQVCVVRADQKNKMAALASDWLRPFSTSPLKPLNGIQRNLTGSKISNSSTKFLFFGLIGKTKGRPGLWLAETFSTSPLKPLNGIQQNLTGSKILISSTKFVFFFGPIE